VRNIDDLHQLALPRHGIITTDQLRSLGITSGIQHRLEQANVLARVHRGVLRLTGFPVDHRQRTHAALAVAGPDAIVSHRSAAWLLGVPIPEPRNVELIIPRSRSLDVPGIVAHRPRDRVDLRPREVDGLPVCNGLRVLTDLGASATPAVVALALDHLLITGAVTISSVTLARNRHRPNGRTGLRALELALHEQRFGAKPPDSVLELAFSRLINRFGIIPPVFHQRMRLGGRLIEPDFTWPAVRLIVEVDGWAYHAGRHQTEDDRERDLLLTSAGYTVVRVTWLRVTRRPGWVAANLQLTMDRLRLAA